MGSEAWKGANDKWEQAMPRDWLVTKKGRVAWHILPLIGPCDRAVGASRTTWQVSESGSKAEGRCPGGMYFY